MAPKLNAGGSTRSLVVTVRLDPKLKYLADLAARKQRRALSSYIEWAIEKSLEKVLLEEGDAFSDGALSVSDADKKHKLWDVDDPERFVRLALYYPDLLTHDEQVLWKLIRECGYLWRGSFRGPGNEWAWTPKEASLVIDRLRENWKTFQEVADGALPSTAIPVWPKFDLKKDKDAGGGWDSGADEIPF